MFKRKVNSSSYYIEIPFREAHRDNSKGIKNSNSYRTREEYNSARIKQELEQLELDKAKYELAGEDSMVEILQKEILDKQKKLKNNTKELSKLQLIVKKIFNL